MAVTITRTPPLVTNLSDIIFQMKVDDGGSGTITKYGMAQLNYGLSNQTATEEKHYKASTTDWNLIFKQQIESKLGYTIPTLSNAAITTDNLMNEIFSLAYWERQIDTSVTTGNNTTNSASQLGGIFNVINGESQYWQELDFINNAIGLTNRPKRYFISSDQPDWLYFYTPTDRTLTCTSYFKDGSQFVQTSNLLLGGVQVIPVGTANAFLTLGISTQRIKEDLAYYKIEVSGAGQNTEFYFYIQPTDCDYVDIIFRESMGGFSSIRFDFDIEQSVQREVDTYTISPTIVTSRANRLIDYGSRSVNSRGRKSFTLSKKFKNEIGYEDYLESFLNAKDFFIKVRNPYTEEWELRRVKMNRGLSRIYKKEQYLDLTAVFQLHKTHNTPV